MIRRVLPTVRIRPIDPNFERGDNRRSTVMDVVDPARSSGSIEQRLDVLQSLIAQGMIAAESFRNETIKVQMLLDAGADVTMRDDQGRTTAERIRNSSNAELRSLLNAQ